MHIAYSLWICWNVCVHIGMFSVFLHSSVVSDKLDDAIALTMRLFVFYARRKISVTLVIAVRV